MDFGIRHHATLQGSWPADCRKINHPVWEERDRQNRICACRYADEYLYRSHGRLDGDMDMQMILCTVQGKKMEYAGEVI